MSEIYYRMLERPLHELRLTTISYMAGNAIGCLQFAFADGAESEKYGDILQIKKVYNIREDAQLVKITVLQNKIALTGFRLTYSDGEVDDLSSAEANESSPNDADYGPVRATDIALSEGEIVVGLTIELADQIPRKIGFTLLRT